MIIIGPVIPASGAKIDLLFHFGPNEGHQCDRAQFDWYLNDVFVSFLDFNNASTGEEVEIGPFEIFLEDYNTDPCGWLKFSFVCKVEGGCHEGAAFDITQPNGEIKTRYINTSAPTIIWICELITEFSTPP